jgi:hypothetical protein
MLGAHLFDLLNVFQAGLELLVVLVMAVVGANHLFS